MRTCASGELSWRPWRADSLSMWERETARACRRHILYRVHAMEGRAVSSVLLHLGAWGERLISRMRPWEGKMSRRRPAQPCIEERATEYASGRGSASRLIPGKARATLRIGEIKHSYAKYNILCCRIIEFYKRVKLHLHSINFRVLILLWNLV